MHEIRATLPRECVAEVSRLAHEVGIPTVSIAAIYQDGPNVERHVVSVETSTPNARRFVEALLASPALSGIDYSLTSRELRAIVNREDIAEITKPTNEPLPDVVQDLWQLSHITPSYVMRAFAGGILLATGIVENNAVAIVVAALFLPFLAEILALTFGVWNRDRRLIRRGLIALGVSAILAFVGGAVVGTATGGPVRFEGFRPLSSSFALSALIGLTAGLSIADDTGRRYLIGVAAAVQLAIVPAWLGAVFVTGMPQKTVVTDRLLGFAVSLMTIPLAAFGAYAMLHLSEKSDLGSRSSE